MGSNNKYNILNEKQADRLTQLIKHFGWNIKELTLSDMELPKNIIELLNFMPNLENIDINYVCLPNPDLDPDVESNSLNLSKLETIKALLCDKFVLNIFKKLPPGVLRKVEILYEEEVDAVYDPSIQLFEFQPSSNTTSKKCKSMISLLSSSTFLG